MKTKKIWSVGDVLKFKSIDVIFDSFILALVFRGVFLNITVVRSYYSALIIADVIALVLGFAISVIAGMIFYPLMFRIRRSRAKDELSKYIVNLEEFQAMHFAWRAKYGTFFGYILFIVCILVFAKIEELTNNTDLALAFFLASPILCIVFVKALNKKMLKKTKTNAFIIDAVNKGVYEARIPNSVSRAAVINVLEKGGADTVKGAVNYIRFTRGAAIVTVIFTVITLGAAIKVTDKIEDELIDSFTPSPSQNTYTPVPVNANNRARNNADYRKRQAERNINYRKNQEKKNAFYQANQKQKKADYQYYKTAEAANGGYYKSAYDHLNRANCAQREADAAWRNAYRK